MSELKFADNVWHRVVQCVQEGIITGTDVSDSLRQIRVVPSEEDPTVLVLSTSYEAQVRTMHEKMLQQARELQAQQAGNRFIIPDDGSNAN